MATKKALGQSRRRKTRMQLGFCYECLKPALPGMIRCEQHRVSQVDKEKRHRGIKVAKRGWKTVRVPV